MRKFLTAETKLARVIPAPEARNVLSTYNQREYVGENEPVKQPQRDSVISHMLAHHRADTDMRLFSLPGLWWAFETQLQAQWPRRMRITAVERNDDVFNNSVHMMPGRARHEIHEYLPMFSVTGMASDTASLLRCTAGAYFAPSSWSWWSKQQRKQWSRQYGRHTALWLDLQCPICDELCIILRHLARCAHPKHPTIPVSITLMAAREGRRMSKHMLDITGASELSNMCRVEFIEKFCNAHSNSHWLRVMDAQAYKSIGNTPMLLINALLCKTERT